jgi:hypothetical protein
VTRKNRTRHQDRFEAYVSFEPETGPFTAAGLTGGSGAAGHEVTVTVRLLAGEEGTVTGLGDAAYGTGELRRHLRDGGRAAVIKQPPLQRAVPAASPPAPSPSMPGPVPSAARRARHHAGPPARRRHPPGKTSTPGRAGHSLASRPWQPPRPYRGIARNNIWLTHRAAALNLRRLANLGLTRTSGTWALA